jgi:hypothetical protein
LGDLVDLLVLDALFNQQRGAVVGVPLIQAVKQIVTIAFIAAVISDVENFVGSKLLPPARKSIR